MRSYSLVNAVRPCPRRSHSRGDTKVTPEKRVDEQGRVWVQILDSGWWVRYYEVPDYLWWNGTRWCPPAAPIGETPTP